MFIPIMIAVALWTHNICEIAKRSGSKDSEPADDNGESGPTISNSAETISHILNSRKNNGEVQYGKSTEGVTKRRGGNKPRYPREEDLSPDIRAVRQIQLHNDNEEIC